MLRPLSAPAGAARAGAIVLLAALTAAGIPGAAAAAAADAPSSSSFEPYSFSITDMSPMLVYSPSSSGPADQTWNQSWSQSDWTKYMPEEDMMGDGISAHSTVFAGASVTLSFLGTGVSFSGVASGSVALIVDGGSDSPSDLDVSNATLASVSGLDYAWHNATLKLHSGALSVQSAGITTYMGGNGARAQNVSMESLQVHSDQLWYINGNMTMNSLNAWQAQTSACGYSGPSSTECYGSYDRASTSTPSAWMYFTIPANTSIIVMYGTVGARYGDYMVTLDPAPYATPNPVTLSGRSDWFGVSAVTFFAALDPTVSYKLTLDYKGNSTEAWDFAGAQFISPVGGDSVVFPASGSSGGAGSATTGGSTPAGTGASSNSGTVSAGSKSSTPIGAVVGGVVGGVLVAAALGVLIWWLLRRRSKNKAGGGTGKKRVVGHPLNPDRPPSKASDFEIDDLAMSATPFINEDNTHATTHANASAHSLNSLSAPRIDAQTGGHQGDPFAAGGHIPPPTKAELAGYGHVGDREYPPSMSSPLPSSPSSPSSTSMSSAARPRFGGHIPADSSYSGHTFGGSLSSRASASATSPITAASSRQTYPLSMGNPSAPVSPVKDARGPAPRRPSRVDDITQESDAGRVVAAGSTVPPRYDPSWAQDLDLHH